MKFVVLAVIISAVNCDFHEQDDFTIKTPNECNPAKTCNVCAECCKPYISDGPACDNCTKAECHGPSPGPSPPPGPHLANEQQLLCDFYGGTQAGDGWLSACKEGWNDICTSPSANYCGAHGISCNPAGHVTDIDLGGCNLRGNIPVNASGSSIFALPALERVLLYNGQGAKCDEAPGSGISGVLPEDVAEASKLRVLGLYCNSFEGDMEVLENLTELQNLDLHYNKFSGNVPKLSKSKASLSYISLANNNLDGPISEDWAQLVHLGTLGLANNKLDGEVLTMITPTNFPNMTVLFLRHNKFTGRIGPHFPPLLQVVDLDHNSFTGIDPAVCDYQLPPAFNKQGGCDSDWPNQGLGTCCMASQATAAGSEWCIDVGKAPQCVSNCQLPQCGVTVQWDYHFHDDSQIPDRHDRPYSNSTSGSLRMPLNSSEVIIHGLVDPTLKSDDKDDYEILLDSNISCSVALDGSLTIEARAGGLLPVPLAQAVRSGCSFMGETVHYGDDDYDVDMNFTARCCFAD